MIQPWNFQPSLFQSVLMGFLSSDHETLIIKIVQLHLVIITKSGLMEDLRLFFAEPNNTNESKNNLLKINISIIYNHSNLIHWFHYWCYWYYNDVTMKKRQNSEHALQSESTLHSWLNVKELLVQNRHDIWSLSDSNEIRNHNHEVRKGKLKW